MSEQILFKNNFMDQLIHSVKNEAGFINNYAKDKFDLFSMDDCWIVPEIDAPEKIRLVLPEEANDHNFQNAKTLYGAYAHLSPAGATDARLWTYLTHVTFWDYMRQVRPVENLADEKKKAHVLRHWFVLSPSDLIRNEISRLWWVAFMTVDNEREDKYELTREVFTMLDYTRTIFNIQGRNKSFMHALLEFVVENPSMFESQKESKVRFLARKFNLLGGYKMLPALEKHQIKDLLRGYAKNLDEIRRQPTVQA